MTSATQAVVSHVGEGKRRLRAMAVLVQIWTAMGNWRLRLSSLMILLLVLLGAFGASALGADPREIGQGPRLAPLSAQWWFGTDTLGRSLLPRVFEGTRVTFVVSLTAVLLTSIVGASLGLLGGYLRGHIDQIIGRTADVLFAFPSMLLALLISGILGFNSLATIVSIVLVTLPLLVRVIRAAALVLAEREFVIGAEVSGASVAYVLVVHLLPNIAGVLAVQAAFACRTAMIVEGGLSFLGLGVQPPDASLGSLVREGSAYLSIAPWLALVPGVVFGLAIFAVSLLGDGLRDLIDPIESRQLL